MSGPVFFLFEFNERSYVERAVYDDANDVQPLDLGLRILFTLYRMVEVISDEAILYYSLFCYSDFFDLQEVVEQRYLSSNTKIE